MFHGLNHSKPPFFHGKIPWISLVQAPFAAKLLRNNHLGFIDLLEADMLPGSCWWSREGSFKHDKKWVVEHGKNMKHGGLLWFNLATWWLKHDQSISRLASQRSSARCLSQAIIHLFE
jgi:hypothetical protein